MRGLASSRPPQLSASMRPRLESPTATIKDGALKHILRERRGSEDVEAVEAEDDDQRADEGAEHVEFAVAQGRRAEEDRGESGQQIGVGGAGRAAAKARGEQRAGQRRADAEMTKPRILMRSTRCRRAAPPPGCRRPPGSPGRSRVRSTSTQRPTSTSAMTMIGFGMPNSQRPRRDLQERLGHAGHDRHAGRIGEGQANQDRADAQRRDHRIDPAAW